MSEHDEHQDQPQHTEFDPHAADQSAERPAPEHAGFEHADPNAPVPDDDGREMSIVEEWGEDYPPGTALFCAKFDADDFDNDWNDVEFGDGTTVAIRRGSGMPPKGWIMRHAHLTDLEREKVILSQHATPDAMQIITSLNDRAYTAFVEAWAKDGGVEPGKSNRSARRSASTKRR